MALPILKPLHPHRPPRAPLPADLLKYRRFQEGAEIDALDPAIIAFASSLAKGLAPDDYLGIVRAVFRWVRDGIRYQSDPLGPHGKVQDFSSAPSILRRGWGNCVCKTKLAVALLRSLGIEAEFVPVWTDNPDGAWLSHVQLRVRFPGSGRIAGNVGGWIYGEMTIKGAELTQDPMKIATNPNTGRLPLSGGPPRLTGLLD